MDGATYRREPADGGRPMPRGLGEPEDIPTERDAAAGLGGPALIRMLIDCMPWPAALLAHDGAVAFGNRRARSCPVLSALDRPGDRSADGLRGAAAPALADALHRVLVEPEAGSVTLRLALPGRTLPACVVVLPLPDTGLLGPRALVTIHDPLAPPVVDRVLLTRMFGLTPAEARVAARLVEGQSPEAISRESGTPLQTVRAQLQAVFGKLAVSRQAALVRMLLSLPGAISIPPNTTAGD